MGFSHELGVSSEVLGGDGDDVRARGEDVAVAVDELDVEHGDGVGVPVGRRGGGEDGSRVVAWRSPSKLRAILYSSSGRKEEGFGDGERDDAVDGEGRAVAREEVVPVRAAAVELRAARRGDEVAAVEVRSRGNGEQARARQRERAERGPARHVDRRERRARAFASGE